MRRRPKLAVNRTSARGHLRYNSIRFRFPDAEAQDVPRGPTGGEPIDILVINPEVEKRQIERVRELRANRPQERWQGALEALRKAAIAKENLMPPIINAVKAYATVGEICTALKDVFGEYEEPLEL